MLNSRQLSVLYALFDFVAALVSWSLFYFFRKTSIEQTQFVTDQNFYYGIVVIPFFWLFFYLLNGMYLKSDRKYRIKVFSQTILQSIIGVTLVFFILILDDQIDSYTSYYSLYFTLMGLHAGCTLITRLTITTIIVKQVHNHKRQFNTLILGGNEKALNIYQEISSMKKGAGNHFIGFLSLNGIDHKLKSKLTHFGDVTALEDVIEKYDVEEVLIAIESFEHDRLREIISRLSVFDIVIKIIPDMFDILSGNVKMNNIYGALLLEINTQVMPLWQQATKRFLDVVLSTVALIICIPLFIIVAILIKSTSKGPIFFFQERIGKNGKPFSIIKFRSMYIGAEKDGPQLSSSDDKRITPVGKFLRKTRIDEFPQFVNVIIGDMSLVGPRPERQHYINKIMEIEPQYRYLNKVRPGITSWGQVKFGYAENVDEMLERMKFDLLYLKNMTLALDFKIMVYTMIIIFKGKGK